MRYVDYEKWWKLISLREIPYLSTPWKVAIEMLKLAEAKKGDVVIDLGAGDGVILIVANKVFGCKAIGYEINPALIKIAKENAKKEGAKIKIYKKDLFTADLKEADIITLYLTPKALALLRHKLEKVREKARIVTHDYEIPGWRPKKQKKVETGKEHTHLIFLY